MVGVGGGFRYRGWKVSIWMRWVGASALLFATATGLAVILHYRSRRSCCIITSHSLLMFSQSVSRIMVSLVATLDFLGFREIVCTVGMMTVWEWRLL